MQYARLGAGFDDFTTSKQTKIETFPALNSMYINHEITCVACYRTEFQWSPSTTFDCCSSCKLVHWCPDHAKSDSKSTLHTPEDCAELKNLFSAERVLIDYALARKSARKIIIHSEPRRSHIPIVQLTSWKDYLRRIHPTLGELLEPLTDEIGGSHPNRATARDALKRVVLEGTSFVATVMYGLEMAFPDVAQRGSLTIHFVGAASYEIDGLGLMEELLHHLPKLKLLKLHYVGPEISPNAILGNTDSTRNWACPLCEAKGRKRFNVLSTLPYHDYIAQNPSAPKPDLVVGLNTGFSEVDVDSWKKSVKAILRLGVPTLFTAYQKEEALLERKMLQRIGGVEFVLPAEENKWRGTIPNVNIMQKLMTGKSLGLSHKNQFLYIVKGVQ
ncbi:hypothetical protein C8R45DRAFT_1094028 [Mycena sanguinolenta]|nr:hypothetical protein C8R45DRAFT_1094028 [Mycena sanguinolenta]